MDVFASGEEQAKGFALEKARVDMLNIVKVEEVELPEDQVIEREKMRQR